MVREVASAALFSLADLPQNCIVHVLSFTSPRDACRLSLVSSAFCSAAKSDVLWDSFLPPDLPSIPFSFSSKKHLYLSLSEKPVLIEQDRKTFMLDRLCGKKCYMISARDLFIVWADTPRYWRWTSAPGARFEEVAELVSVCWLEIRGLMKTSMLSPATLYAAYLVFKRRGAYGFKCQPVEVSIGIGENDSNTHKRTVYLELESERGPKLQYRIVPRRAGIFNRTQIMELEARTPIPTENPDLQCASSIPTENPDLQYPNQRADGWLEIELGDFFNEGGDDKNLEMAVCEVKGGDWKGGLIIQGFDIRPKLNK